MHDVPDKLQIILSQVKEEGEEIAGDLPPEIFDLPDDDRVSFPNPLVYRLRVSKVGEGVLVQGEASSVLRCRCDRCLAYFDNEQREAEVCHFLEAPLPEVVDLTADLREDILIGLPQKLICQPACKGLCPQCGQNLNVRACACVPAGDSKTPWESLDGLQL